MKRKWMILIAIIAVAGLWTAKKFLNKSVSDKKVTISEFKGTNYWTCPMHPQVHLDHAGECPICHMKLVQVKVQQSQAQIQAAESSRAQVQASSDQLALIGVQKQQVERMDLNLSIPVSGRVESHSGVAFQVYESDIHFIHVGLPFKGQSSFIPNGEITGVITSVDSIVDPTSRTIRVLGQIQKGPKGLISETTFSGAVTVIRKESVAIPESSVLHTGTGDLVYVFTDGGKLVARKVMLGAKTEGFYEVVSNLEPGEFISSGPNFLIDSEAKIRGTSESTSGKAPVCPEDQHWDIPMLMCMPGKATK